MQPPQNSSNNPNAPIQYTPPPPASPNPLHGQGLESGAHGYPPPPGQYPYAPPPGRKLPWWAFVLGGCGCLALFVPILAAILFPVFAQAREKARATTCLSNVKQMSTAVMMYAEDYDQTLPRSVQWMDSLEPYCKGETSEFEPYKIRVFHCPTVSRRDETVFGYAFDIRLNHQPMGAFPDGRQTVMIFDSATRGKNASDPFTSAPYPGRHAGKNAVGFLDGHASLQPRMLR